MTAERMAGLATEGFFAFGAASALGYEIVTQGSMNVSSDPGAGMAALVGGIVGIVWGIRKGKSRPA